MNDDYQSLLSDVNTISNDFHDNKVVVFLGRTGSG